MSEHILLEKFKIKRTLIRKAKRMPIYKERLFTDFGGIGYYRVISIYNWEEYCECAYTPEFSHWFQHSMAKIRTEQGGITYKIPWIELGCRSVYENGNLVLK